MSSSGTEITAVILAGGVGTRLRPYTVSLPKPLMPIGEHPILEIVIRQLKNSGVNRIIIAVGYLESLIRAYFGDGSKYGVEILYSTESQPMGTAGPLTLISDLLDDTFVFMNGDVFSDIIFSDLIEYHCDRRSIATVAVTKRSINIDFGVLEIGENQSFEKWREKPTLEYNVSMGIYILEPDVIRFLPEGSFNIPDLIVALREKHERVCCYTHKGYWLDIGRQEDYEQACADVSKKGIEFWLKRRS